MLSEIKTLLESTPFQPFALRAADGREYLVPTIDHIYLPPGSRKVIVTDDKGVTISIPLFYITGLVETSFPAATGETPSKP